MVNKWSWCSVPQWNEWLLPELELQELQMPGWCQSEDTELNTRSFTYEKGWTPLFFTDYPVILIFFFTEIEIPLRGTGKKLCSKKCCHKYLNIYVTFEYFSSINISITEMGKWVYRQKCKILNLMNTSRTSSVTTSPHFCSVLKPHRFLPRKWTDASQIFSLHKPDRIAALKTSLCAPLTCPSEAGLEFQRWNHWEDKQAWAGIDSQRQPLISF